MLDRILLTYLKPDSPRILPKLRQFMSSISTQVELTIDRQEEVAGAETSGMRILEQILGDTDITSLRKIRDDCDRYLTYLLPLQEDIVRHIDPGIQGVVQRGGFVTTAKPGREYIVPVSCSNYIRQLPMNQEWAIWSEQRPVRLMFSDSPDLSLNAYLDKLHYSKHPPTHVVVSVDAIMLILQYAKYLDTVPLDERLSIANYLHTFVIYPALVHDSVTTWMCGQYARIFNLSYNKESIPKLTPLSTPIMGSFGNQFGAAVEEIWDLAASASDQNVTPTKLLSSLLLLHTNVPHMYRSLRLHTEVPQLRQNLWVQYMLTAGWRNLVFATIDLTKTHPMTKQVALWTKRDFHLLLSTRFWSSVNDTFTKNYIEEDLHKKIEILNSF